ADLCNRFLTAKLHKVNSGELGSRMFQEYRETTDLIVAAFGKTRLVEDLAADDFEQLRATMAERWGPVRLGNGITRVKTVFKFGLDAGAMERLPRYGGEFRKPNKAVLRRHRATNGAKMLEADELRQLINAAPVPFKAMLLLGVNCGFGNADCGALPLTALDLDAAMIDYPRPKTGIARRCPLWPETVAALREALAVRPEPKDKADANLVFLLSVGRRWVSITEKSRNDNVSIHFTNLMKTLGIHREGIGFYTLRHVFRTIADAARDPVAIDLIMGHTDPSMAAHYRERIEDSRLQAVVEHVRAWLFAEAPDGGTTDVADGTTPENSGSCEPSDVDAGRRGVRERGKASVPEGYGW
ncbi:MAG: tyrosine-type recombinase/integrase, partial [Gemmataceae bacterium]